MKPLTLAKLLIAAIAGTAASFAVADPITFTDQRDRTVTIDGVAERVVTIPIPAASLFISVDGGTDKLACLLYTSPSPRDGLLSRMPSSA